MNLTPTLLLILDGWGIAPEGPGNAARLARTPHIDALWGTPPRAHLEASGRAVGLPAGLMGNSEVGHLNIGAGRVVYQDMTRVDAAIEQNELGRNQVLLDLAAAIHARKGRLHLLGLVSDGGVHSHVNHLKALLAFARDQKLDVLVHVFTDGRDTSPTSGLGFVQTVQAALNSLGIGHIASLCGRYYAMDRDKHWERIKVAWDLLFHGTGEKVRDAVGAMQDAYATGETDEFLKPRLVEHAGINSTIQDNDGIFMFNFRADRARQLARALSEPDFGAFDRGDMPKLAGIASMTAYEAHLAIPVAFPKESLHEGLGEVVSRMGGHQLRIAETEKYAHVTYFFNGGREEPFAGEDRIMISSPREVATYDLKPEMSAFEVTEKLLAAIRSGSYDFIVCNLANPDMVGHTGISAAAVRACEVTDECVGRIATAMQEIGGRLVMIADHGNVEELLDAAGKPQTAHTTNFVGFAVQDPEHTHVRSGKLADVAPTILALWGVCKPASMTGNVLCVENQAQ